MHRHDLDLIAALADGSLDDETEARALVESCEECRAEHRSQLAVLELLGSTPRVGMSDLERAALHRDLWTELSSRPSKARSGRSWYRWSYVAAGLFVAVGLAGVITGQIQRYDEESAGVAQTFAEADSDLSTFSAEDSEMPLQDAESASGGGETAATTTMAAEEALPFPFAELADQARAARESGERSSPISSSEEDIDRCLLSAGLADEVVVEELDLDQRYLVVMARDVTSEPTVTFIAVDSCEIVYVDG